ncbi:MAG: 50S ribosomal protein L1 [Candidatus Micrarchaeota archaeon]|nr:50S ribosomal protein L1 [Candidatus Micrarchaeota archaeon]
MDRKQITEAIQKALQSKGSRKFVQSLEFIINFRNIDFTKAENRLNLDIVLPKGRGKIPPVVVFAEGQLALDAKNAGADEVFDSAGIAKLASDRQRLAALAKSAEFIAQPNLMIAVGKSLGQVLGSKGKLPRPIAGTNVKEAIDQARRRVRLLSRGKYLPVSQCVIGSENMEISDLVENFEAVYEKVKGKVLEPNIKSVYVKLSMGKPVKVGSTQAAG